MPNIGVHAIIVNENNHILLVKKNYLQHDWVPPGGIMEENESIQNAIYREVLEETGYKTELCELITIGSRSKTNDIIIVVKAKIICKTNFQIDSREIEEVGFFPLDKLPTPMKSEVSMLLRIYSEGVVGKILEI